MESIGNKSRCIVEDATLLREGEKVLVMIPKTKEYKNTIFTKVANVIKDPVLVQFGGKHTTKYYLLEK